MRCPRFSAAEVHPQLDSLNGRLPEDVQDSMEWDKCVLYEQSSGKMHSVKLYYERGVELLNKSDKYFLCW